MRCRVCNRKIISGTKHGFCSWCNSKRMKLDVSVFDAIGVCYKCHKRCFCTEIPSKSSLGAVVRLLCPACYSPSNT